MTNILFLVTGTTPQIVTETVWALACDPDLSVAERFIPDEIHVLSTENGLKQIRLRLFDDGVFAGMQADYPQLANIRFSGEYLHAICHEDTTLEDLKTPNDNELAADLICQKVREFTERDDAVLHVSIAGGRKTMGFYAGYALSLYGRACDSMSHVLVESEFETAKGFYYPTTYDKYVEQNSLQKRLNAKDAKIWLAKIPFVQMRHALPKDSFIASASFREVVDSINLSQSKLVATLNEMDKTVSIAGKQCKLSPREFAFYLWLAKRKKDHQPGVSRPIEGVPYDFTDEYLAVYESLGKNRKTFDFDEKFFDQRNTYIKKNFKKEFGDAVAEKIGIQKQKNGLYECVLDADQIIINEF